MNSIFKHFSCALLMAGLLSACGAPTQTIHHWKGRNDIGPHQFIVDHNLCVRSADWWPFSKSAGEMVDAISPGPHDPKHRLDPSADRIWASFIPYQGAQAIYVNDPHGSSMVDSADYENCMSQKGYYKAYETETRNNLIHDRSKGYREDAN